MTRQGLNLIKNDSGYGGLCMTHVTSLASPFNQRGR